MLVPRYKLSLCHTPIKPDLLGFPGIGVFACGLRDHVIMRFVLEHAMGPCWCFWAGPHHGGLLRVRMQSTYFARDLSCSPIQNLNVTNLAVTRQLAYFLLWL
jgi:hypothetical protein